MRSLKSVCENNFFFDRNFHKMSIMLSIIKPPEAVRNMTVLDKSMFLKDITVPIVQLQDACVTDILPYIKKYFLKIRHIKPIQTSDDNNKKYVLLNQNIKNYFEIDETDRSNLKKYSIDESNFSTIDMQLTYDNFHADEIFKAILPTDQDGFSSFSQIGHILHLNLREHILPFKNIIGQVLLEKIPKARTVINKIDIIDNTYRNFEMEIICGDPDMMVQIKQNYCMFEFDFSKVYWNPRLSTEHERLVKTLNKGDVLFDVFAGVGPFSIPAAKKGCVVYANDLNPDSYKWLLHNRKKNKIDVNVLNVFNRDGRDFIREELKENLIKHINKCNVIIVMNLPALAVEFLNSFLNLLKYSEIVEIQNSPTLHVYCFAKGEDVIGIAKKLVNEHFGFDVEDKILDIFRVRTVSNFKEMIRVSIKLDADILVSFNEGKRRNSCSIETQSKKSCNGETQQETIEKSG